MGALALSAAGVSKTVTADLYVNKLMQYIYVQVERAFKMYFTGQKVNIGKFSRDNTEALVADYVENTKKLSERRWKQILERCGSTPVAENEHVESVPRACMDERRRALYVPSSPTKGSDEE